MKSNDGQHALEDSGGQRLDIWLWASRFYKTRKIATDAVAGGHVWVNNKRSKPSKTVKIDDELRVKRSSQEFTLIITGLSLKRLGAPMAAKLYQETELSRSKRKIKQQLMRDQRAGIQFDHKRPGKRDRQKMMRAKTLQPKFE
ncbi:MAG: RNA-binding S4 domain-containing protein [Arenicellales bacterium]